MTGWTVGCWGSGWGCCGCACFRLRFGWGCCAAGCCCCAAGCCCSWICCKSWRGCCRICDWGISSGSTPNPLRPALKEAVVTPGEQINAILSAKLCSNAAARLSSKFPVLSARLCFVAASNFKAIASGGSVMLSQVGVRAIEGSDALRMRGTCAGFCVATCVLFAGIDALRTSG